MNSNSNEHPVAASDGSPRKKQADWRADLIASRDLMLREKEGYTFFLDWFERWRLQAQHPPDRKTANCFWREKVLDKERLPWQIDQWMEAMEWYLRWLELCKETGIEVRSVPERMRAAVDNVGARRGLMDRTLESYGSWVVRYGQWAGTAKRAMDPAVGREFLSYQVQVKEVAQSTQKQCLCALVFFFKDICGMEEVDLGIKFRKTTPRTPVVLDVDELVALIGKLTATWTLAAQLQYGSGMRRSEVMSLRIKDVDTKRRTITIRKGKGDKDRVTVFPEGLVKAFESHKAEVRQVFEADRAAGRPGVFIAGALGRKMSRAGERWEWFWLFPSDEESRDKKSGITRRHHLHPNSYGNAISDAARAAGVEKRVTSHALRHSFATHALDGGVNLRTLQELLGHADVKQTERYTHLSKRLGAAGIESPLDAELVRRVAEGLGEEPGDAGDLPENCVVFPGS